VRKASQHLREPGPADAEMASKWGTALELAGVKQSLVMAGEFQRIAGYLGSRLVLRFGKHFNRAFNYDRSEEHGWGRIIAVANPPDGHDAE
jgi:hypothetical protein